MQIDKDTSEKFSKLVKLLGEKEFLYTMNYNFPPGLIKQIIATMEEESEAVWVSEWDNYAWKDCEEYLALEHRKGLGDQRNE